MYIYFPHQNSVITCDEYPMVLSVADMLANNLQHICNKWEKNDIGNGLFTLSYKYDAGKCNCNNADFVCINDYSLFDCYNCGRLQDKKYKTGTKLYLQNSGSLDIVCSMPNETKLCYMSSVKNMPNVYEWVQHNDAIFALHIDPKTGTLSDRNIRDKLNNSNYMKNYCYITFTENIEEII